MNELVSIVFTLVPVVVVLSVGVWRRRQIYRQDDVSPRRRR